MFDIPFLRGCSDDPWLALIATDLHLPGVDPTQTACWLANTYLGQRVAYCQCTTDLCNIGSSCLPDTASCVPVDLDKPAEVPSNIRSQVYFQAARPSGGVGDAVWCALGVAATLLAQRVQLDM